MNEDAVNTRDRSTPLRVLSRSDLADVPITPGEVVRAVEDAYLAFAAGDSDNPRKLSVANPDGWSVAYAMLGRDGRRRVVAMKTSYKFDPGHDRSTKRYYTTITLYDDTTGAPIAMMDCARVGALRTPAVSALLVRETMRRGAESVLLIGTGTQGRNALPHLLAANPQLRKLMVYGTHAEGLAAVHRHLAEHNPHALLETVEDPRAAAAGADVVLATAGPGTEVALESADLAPGSTVVLVGYGLAPSTLVEADRVVATSAEQMRLTGTDMAGPDGTLRGVDAELPHILTRRAVGRRSDEEKIFVYNSGLVLTDIAVAHALAERAIAEGRGTEVPLWD
ncbi:ornithine cyclodeaminase family protein [Nocardia farcinica]|uniref:ornithine cyclodeaminase family protein n=1 Tax=Nocardia TaxID=1817 RepID=UPI000DFF9350|nr:MULTISPECIES: ornithine cyclodeaminase family protein [Nocardia]MBA4856552.1 ornithine cyclodeaminase family protein [Nocardia farcinica]MBC9816555.1 ornithine cyclodeaminase family protein [Nocardia farcinica]MBF6069320.1 ornithine cyclodeaminase family protein [Nocardia farcinica]MBF6142919.1 ornithine cyclodeaminase family protein [Nocardia farcinica]MBF6188835.1 ornithine cyclodeaminase family protein [Nocardia farcinica]